MPFTICRLRYIYIINLILIIHVCNKKSFRFFQQNTFGDIYIPEEFDPPKSKDVGQLNKNHGHNVSSGTIEIIDAKTIRIQELNYDGFGEDTYFWVGQGSRPSPKGIKVPDENG